MALVEPVAARYRATLALNLAAMALAVLLGSLRRARDRAARAAGGPGARSEARVRELERQLFHAERLTTVGRLAAGIAHEINNPLEGIANYLSLAREALDRGDAEAARRRLEGVRPGPGARGPRRAPGAGPRRSRPRPRKRRAGPQPRPGRDRRSSCARGRSSRACASRLALAERPLLVVGSPIMLGQVALEPGAQRLRGAAGGRRGARQLAARRRAAPWPRSRTAARASPTPTAQRIFEPFFSTKNSTGLGLSICHAIVAAARRASSRPCPARAAGRCSA